MLGAACCPWVLKQTMSKKENTKPGKTKEILVRSMEEKRKNLPTLKSILYGRYMVSS